MPSELKAIDFQWTVIEFWNKFLTVHFTIFYIRDKRAWQCEIEIFDISIKRREMYIRPYAVNSRRE